MGQVEVRMVEWQSVKLSGRQLSGQIMYCQREWKKIRMNHVPPLKPSQRGGRIDTTEAFYLEHDTLIGGRIGVLPQHALQE